MRRVIQVLREPEEQREPRLWWSHFRRQHQAGARRCHWERRARQAPFHQSQELAPIRLAGVSSLTDVQWEQIRPLE